MTNTPAAASRRRPNRRRSGATAPRPETSAAETIEVTGALRLNPRGFGFVDPDDATHPSCFVPPAMCVGLVDTDTVTVTVDPADERATATSVNLVHRRRRTLIGTVTADGFAADPFCASGTFDIDGEHPAAGTAAVAVVDPAASTIRVLEEIASDDVDRVTVCVRHQLPYDETSPQLHTPRRRSARPRRDLRELTTVTIDADHSGDLDDALSVLGVDRNGGLRVLVHIADVAEVVTPGSPADVAAAAVATSIYLPGWTRHMLPTQLSCDELSLNPGVERDTITVELRIAPDGTVTAADLFESTIRSDVRLSHTVAGALLAGADLAAVADRDDPHNSLVAITDDVVDTVRWLRTAGARLGATRSRRGGASPRRSDPGTVVGGDDDATWQRFDAAAHDLVEELMVATSAAVGAWLADRALPGLWRCHDRPSADAVAELEAFASLFGFYAGFGDTFDSATFGAFVAQLEVAPGHADAVWELMAGLLPAAEYRTSPGAHFGLGVDRYTHFTSPIRRYADLVVHRVIKAYLSGERRADAHLDGDELDAVTGVINDRSRAAARAENQMRRLLALRTVAAAPRVPVRLRVTGVRHNGLRVTTPEGVWGTLGFAAMEGRWDADGHTARRSDGETVRVGDTIDATIERCDPETLTLTFTQRPQRPRRSRPRR